MIFLCSGFYLLRVIMLTLLSLLAAISLKTLWLIFLVIDRLHLQAMGISQLIEALLERFLPSCLVSIYLFCSVSDQVVVHLALEDDLVGALQRLCEMGSLGIGHDVVKRIVVELLIGVALDELVVLSHLHD